MYRPQHQPSLPTFPHSCIQIPPLLPHVDTFVCLGRLPGPSLSFSLCPHSHSCTLAQDIEHRQTFKGALLSAPRHAQAGRPAGWERPAVLTSALTGKSSQLSTLHNIPYCKGHFTEKTQRPHNINLASFNSDLLPPSPSLSFSYAGFLYMRVFPDSSLVAVGYWSLVLKLHLPSTLF